MTSKHSLKHRMWTLAVLFLGMGLSNLFAAETLQWRAQVQSVKGKATWNTNGGPVVPLKVNSILTAGTTIKTGSETTVDLFLGQSAGVIRVGENTTFSLDKLTVTDTGAEKAVDIQLGLPSGEMYFNVNKLSRASRYEIKVPNGVAGIRGTGGRVIIPPQGGQRDMEIVLTDGNLVFAYLPPGGGAPIPVVLSAPPPVVWKPSTGTQPAPDDLVRSVRGEIEQSKSQAAPPPPPPPATPPTETPPSPNVGGTAPTGGSGTPPPPRGGEQRRNNPR